VCVCVCVCVCARARVYVECVVLCPSSLVERVWITCGFYLSARACVECVVQACLHKLMVPVLGPQYLGGLLDWVSVGFSSPALLRTCLLC
jgi:hypothetical protein